LRLLAHIGRFTLLCVQCVRNVCVRNLAGNQRGGTVHGHLANARDQVGVDVRRDRDRAVPQKLGHGADVRPTSEPQRAGTLPQAWKLSSGSGWP
jgi:hypothetical protein